MIAIDLRDANQTLRLALALQKCCGITPSYSSPNYYNLRLCIGLSVSPAMERFYRPCIDKLSKNERKK